MVKNFTVLEPGLWAGIRLSPSCDFTNSTVREAPFHPQDRRRWLLQLSCAGSSSCCAEGVYAELLRNSAVLSGTVTFVHKYMLEDA